MPIKGFIGNRIALGNKLASSAAHKVQVCHGQIRHVHESLGHNMLNQVKLQGDLQTSAPSKAYCSSQAVK